MSLLQPTQAPLGTGAVQFGSTGSTGTSRNAGQKRFSARPAPRGLWLLEPKVQNQEITLVKLKKIAIVFNPKGGSARQDIVNRLSGAFTSQGIEVAFFSTTPEPGSAKHLASQAAAAGFDLVVAVGGDGTVCQVAEGLMGTEVPMAVFPGGTGNLFARTFYSPPKPEAFAQMVLAGQPQPIDMVQLQYQDVDGKDHDQLLLVALGLGKVSDAISDASPFFKRLFGKLAYVFKVTLACLWPNSRKFEITTGNATADGEGHAQTEAAAAVFVINVLPPTMAMMSRGCNASDGMLDIVVFRATNMFHLIAVASCLAFGCPERSSHYRRIRAKEVTIKANKTIKPNIDGDPGAKTLSVTLRAKPQAVRMILS